LLDAEGARELAAIFPALGAALGVDPGDARRDRDPRTRRLVAARALAQVLRAGGDDAFFTQDRAVVLLLDDVHWGDVDSARLLVDLLASDPGPLLVVLAHRTDEVGGPFLDEIARWARDTRSPVAEVPVTPLSPGATTLLAEALTGDPHAA